MIHPWWKSIGFITQYGPRQANLVLIAYASSEGSGEPAYPRSLARTSAARSYNQWVKRNLQTESQIPSPSEWLGMRSYNLSWRNARRHKFAWHGSYAIRKATENNCVSSWENLFCHMRTTKAQISLRTSCLDSLIPLVSIAEISSLCLASVDAQAGLCLTWSQTPKTGFLVTWLI